MSILVDRNTRLLVQGLTGKEGQFHAGQMIEYGTKVVAGVTPGKGGTTTLDVPVFDTVEEAVRKTDANVSIIYVPAPFSKDACLEALDAGVPLVVCITEGIPTFDMIDVYHAFRAKGATLLGPNCPGVISPGKAKVGIMPGSIHKEGHIGVISRSGTLTYEIVWELTSNNLGQSTCIGIGGDPIIGTTFVDALERFEKDPETQAVVMIGEIGGTDEEDAAVFVRKQMTKPVIGFIAGRTAPPGKRMGHAGAIITGGDGTAESKTEVLKANGVKVAMRPDQVADMLKEALR